MSRKFRVVVNGQPYDVEVEEVGPGGAPRPPAAITLPVPPMPVVTAPQAAPQTVVGGAGDVVAPLPGLVVKIMVEVGTAVSAGQPVLILEAMKMENELAAPKAGTVKEIRTAKGAAVAAGDVLLVIG